MKLPNKITIGGATYSVEQPDIVKGCRGDINYTQKKIRVAKYTLVIDDIGGDLAWHSYKDIPAFIRDNTFWHEMTHAILWDMGHKLATNEEFVTRCANRLTDAIASAQFTEAE